MLSSLPESSAAARWGVKDAQALVQAKVVRSGQSLVGGSLLNTRESL
jgi:hypothetical protein